MERKDSSSEGRQSIEEKERKVRKEEGIFAEKSKEYSEWVPRATLEKSRSCPNSQKSAATWRPFSLPIVIDSFNLTRRLKRLFVPPFFFS